MNKNKRIILSVLVGVSILIFGFLMLTHTKINQDNVNKKAGNPQANASQYAGTKTVNNGIVTYQNDKLGYKFSYPESYQVTENEKIEGTNEEQYHYIRVMDSNISFQVQTNLNPAYDLNTLAEMNKKSCVYKDPRSFFEITKFLNTEAIHSGNPFDTQLMTTVCKDQIRELNSSWFSEGYNLFHKGKLINIILNTKDGSKTDPKLREILTSFAFL